jgi:hypothetical protein
LALRKQTDPVAGRSARQAHMAVGIVTFALSVVMLIAAFVDHQPA